MKIKYSNIQWHYINLDSRVDRNAHMIQLLAENHIDAARVSALTGDDTYGNLDLPPTYAGGIKECLLSHYKLWSEFDRNSDKVLGIFEDDMYICQDFFERFKYIEDNFDKDWDIFFLSSFYHLNNDPQRWNEVEFEFTDIRYIHRVYSSFCTHSYLVNPASLDKLITLSKEHVKDSYAVDHLLILIQKYLNCYAFTPGMTMQKTNESDITGGIKNQESFIETLGQHVYVNNLTEFNYDKFYEQNTNR